MELFPIDEIPLHIKTDFDEILGYVLVSDLELAEAFFPGINDPVLRFYDAGRQTPDGQYATWDWIRKHRKLPIGIWGSPFDEHPLPGQEPPKVKVCAAELVARHLGITEWPELRSLLRFARRVNNTATAHPEDISSVIKQMHDHGEMPVGDIVYWAEQGILAKFKEDPESPECNNFHIEHIARLMRAQNPDQVEEANEWLHQAQLVLAIQQEKFLRTVEEYRANKNKILINFVGYDRKRGYLRPMKLLVICSDNYQIHKAAYSYEGDQVAVTVQIRSTGNVAVLSNHYYGLGLRDVAKAVKLEEPPEEGQDRSEWWWKELVKELAHGCWYYHPRAENLYNGSKTSPHTPPTKQNIERLVELVLIALREDEFEHYRQDKCRQGICASNERDPCPWYHFGFDRCHAVRKGTWQPIQFFDPKAERPAEVECEPQKNNLSVAR